MYQPRFAYSFEEWEAHFAAASLHPQKASNSSPAAWAAGYFPEWYLDSEEACYKRDRFLAAMSFWVAHSSEFDFGGVLVDGEDQALIGFPLIMALYRFYSGIPDEHLGITHPTVQMIKEDAQRYDVE
jgi:hypothetical protein